MWVGENAKTELPIDTQEAILAILKRGRSAEVKKEHNNIVVVEIDRKVRDKTSANG